MSSWLFVAGILVTIYLCAVATLLLAGRKNAAREIARLLPNFVILFKGLLTDTRVSRGDRWLLILAVAWVASPIDLIPEFIPFLGPLDDAVMVALVLRRVAKRVGSDVIREHWRGDPRIIQKLLGDPR